MKKTKAAKKAAEIVDKNKLYTVEEAFELIEKLPKRKFDETVELHVRLGVDSRNPTMNIMKNRYIKYSKCGNLN